MKLRSRNPHPKCIKRTVLLSYPPSFLRIPPADEDGRGFETTSSSGRAAFEPVRKRIERRGGWSGTESSAGVVPGIHDRSGTEGGVVFEDGRRRVRALGFVLVRSDLPSRSEGTSLEEERTFRSRKGSRCASKSVGFVPAASILDTASCLHATMGKCFGSVDPSVIGTSR